MGITVQETAKVAYLAGLSFSPAELDTLRSQLDRILAFMQTLDRVNLPEDIPEPPAASDPTPLREDCPGASLDVEQALANAPARQARHFLVPRIIDGSIDGEGK